MESISSLSWHYKSFADLDTTALYRILTLRTEVFVVEQTCIYQDMDGKDENAFHLYALDQENQPHAYCRVLSAGSAYAEVAIGRVLTSEKARGTGLGHELMKRTLVEVEKAWGAVPIRLSAQEHLQGYYQRWGFTTVSEMYLEDGIPHVEMLRN